MRASENGFTIVELLVVVVIIGILSAIAIAKFVHLKESAYRASMQADLRNLALYEQNYIMDHSRYFAGDGAGQGFVRTPGVTVRATSDPGPPPTWEATARHNPTGLTCKIAAGGDFWTITCP